MSTRVLLVEDYGDARQMYAEYLEHKGYEVLQAADGSQALAHAVSDRTPNVVVLDFALPGMDGFEVARRLRTIAKTALVPIIKGAGGTITDWSGGPAYPADAIIAAGTSELHRQVVQAAHG